MQLTLGHSPDPDDAFMFYALAKNKIETHGYEFEHILQDIETLNQRAKRQELDISAISIHAYAYVLKNYALLPCGASMGDNYGPRLVALKPYQKEDLSKLVIAVPGKLTSAFLALQLYLGLRDVEFEYRVVGFDEIFETVKAGRADVGLIIHEGQLTYKAEGFHLIEDLGAWWHQKTGGLPLPLGGNVIRKGIGAEKLPLINKILKESIQYSLDHRQEALAYAKQWGRGLDDALNDEFVGMYVNELTLDYGDRGKKAIALFLQEAHEMGIIPEPVELEFVQ